MPREEPVLVAVDDSDAAWRAVDYVGRVLAGSPRHRVALVHVLGPVPTDLMGLGGAEDPGREALPWYREMFHRHLGDRIVPRAHGLTVWVVG